MMLLLNKIRFLMFINYISFLNFTQQLIIIAGDNHAMG
jgi:hypothetical protein